MAGDPSHNVHQDLLPHIHLISAYRYPLVPQFGIPDVTEWLLNAPRIARDAAPFFWTYLDSPQDGTIILTWQPLQRMGTEFATDGYVWPRGETYYQHEIRDGLILEVFHQPVGYRPGDDTATHSRRRFRLMPPKVPNPNIPQVDPSLWLVHYGPADDMSTIAVKKIRLEPRLRSLTEQRSALQRAGQITRKEFMLSDRVNWPHIPLPRDARGPPMYGGPGGPVSAHHVPQQMAYPPHGAGGNLPAPPPSKRARHSAVGANPAAPGLVGGQPGMGPPPPHMVPQVEMNVFEDEEDTSRGDMFDNITPRDVSLERYKQNHEWMEEVISSPYRMGQIGYADLGLGLKGELAPVTEGIFEGQGSDAYQRAPAKPYVGRLDAGLAEEFRQRVNEKIRSSNEEIAKIKAEHERVMANFRKNSVIRAAEHDLRTVPALTPEQDGGMHLESRLDATDGGYGGSSGSGSGGSSGSEGHWSQQKPQRSVREIVSHVESSLRSKIVPTPVVVRVEAGGYQEPEPEPELVVEPEAMLDVSGTGAGAGAEGGAGGHGGMAGGSPSGSQISGIMVGEADIDMGDTAASLLDQMESAISPVSTPGPGPSNNGGAGVSAAPPAQPFAGATAPAMVGAPATGAPTHAVPASAGPGGVPGATQDDWVVVPAGGGVSPTGEAGGHAAGIGAPATTSGPAVTASTSLPSASAAPLGPGGLAGAVPAPAGSTGSGLGSTPGVLDGSSGGDFATLTDLEAGGEGLGDLEMDMEESAFGNAFHGAD